MDRISCGELEKAFLRSSTSRADRYKLGLALIIEGVFNAPDSHASIELPTLSIVDDLDMFYSNSWGRVSYIHLIRDFRRRLGRKFVDAMNKKEKAVTYTVHDFPIAMQLHMSATLRPTEAELRDIIPSQLHPELLASGGNVGNSRGDCALVSSGGGSEDDEESGDSDDEGAGEETGGDKSGDGNGETSDEGDSGDSEDEHTRTPQTGTYSTPPMHRRNSPNHAPSTSYIRQGQTSGASLTRAEVEELLLDQRTLIKIHLHTIKLEIMQHVTDEFVKVRDFISTFVLPSLSRSTPPMAQAANEPTVLGSLLHVHERGVSPSPVDQDEDMDKEMQERNGGAGMESEPPMNDDNDEVAFGGSRKHEDDRVASPTSVAEAEGGCGMDFEPENNSDDDKVPFDGSGNRQHKPIAYVNGVAEVDVQMIVNEDASTPSMVTASQLAVHIGCLTRVNVVLTKFLLLVAMIVV
ncbi:Hypothetical predicted protein [Olea europaea subsp. europaea]|uniref:DUF1985 domain-containing protein n=1 Tax=Olea europaea subsp. europaea TaxID=158383 RepID=A0A8S0PFH4_OLEEU|nr:Hypothetical predicted protein [Olea europaea subsp. europaea]